MKKWLFVDLQPAAMLAVFLVFYFLPTAPTARRREHEHQVQLGQAEGRR